MKLSKIFFASFLILGSCSMQQDPLTGAPDAIRQGLPPSANKPVAAKPLPKEAMHIDVPSLVNGRVGTPIEFKVSGRVLDPKWTFKINIENLGDFPGASFDVNTGEFKWTPNKKMMSGFQSIELPLKITMVSESNTVKPVISVEKKNVLIVVVNSYSKPIINSISGGGAYSAGLRHYFQLSMEDVDAVSANDISLDIKDCSTTYNSNSIAHLVDIRKIDADSVTPSKFKAEVIMDLSTAVNLPSGPYCFAVRAVSKFGVVSDIYKKEISIDARMKNTKITVDNAFELKIGEKSQISFSIFDPATEGVLTLKSIDDIASELPGSSITCRYPSNIKYQLDCMALIDGTSATDQLYSIKMVVENASLRNSQKTTTNHYFRFQMKAVAP